MSDEQENKSSGPVAPTQGGAEINRGGRDAGTPAPVGKGSADIARQDGGRVDADHADELVEQADEDSFPASDPPSYTPITSIGPPEHK